MNNQEISSPPKYNEAPTFEQTKTRSQELFYSVFNFNMVNSPCHMIFGFKKLIKYHELRLRLYKSQNLLNRTFKEFNNSLDDGEPPIKNRRDLYLFLKEFYSDVQNMCSPYPNTDYRMMTRLMKFLTKKGSFTFEANDLALVLLKNSCYNNKCKQDLDELDKKTQRKRLDEYRATELTSGEQILANSGCLRFQNCSGI